MTLLALSACSPYVITSSSDIQPELVVETEPAVVDEGQPASVGGETSGYTPVIVDEISVEIGPEAAIAANVIVSLNLPDTCAQVERVRTVQDGDTFLITLGTIPSQEEGCIQDTPPQRIIVPLNITDLPIGDYAVDVNGVRGEFSITDSESTGALRTLEMPTYMDTTQVNDVSIVVGVGSPIPMHAIVFGSLPKGCGQLGEAQIKRDGNTFLVRLTAELPAQTDCNPKGFPFRLEVPLNIVNLPEGTYEVNVNGVVTTFDIPLQ